MPFPCDKMNTYSGIFILILLHYARFQPSGIWEQFWRIRLLHLAHIL